MSQVLVIDSDKFDEHIASLSLPEKSDRTSHIRDALRKGLKENSASWVLPIDGDWSMPLTVHKEDYVNHVKAKCSVVQENQSTEWISNDSEVCVTKGSEWALLHGCSSAIQAVDEVFSDSSYNSVYCNTRPPGHHAYPGMAMGFCIFNNVWIAANHALNVHRKRVCVLDWDVHHGNGTESFVDTLNSDVSKRLMYIGTQQDYSTLWPQTGKPISNGGKNHNINRYNFTVGSGDKEVKDLWGKTIIPKIFLFNPDVIIISCGFDAHKQDPLGGLNFSTEIYGWMTEKLKGLCPRMVSILEGGYNCSAIADAALCHVNAMSK